MQCTLKCHIPFYSRISFLKSTKFVPWLNTILFDSFHLLRGSNSSRWAEDIGISWEPWGCAAVWVGSEPESFTRWWREVGGCEDCLCLSGYVAWVPSPTPPTSIAHSSEGLTTPALPQRRLHTFRNEITHLKHLRAAMSYLILQLFPHLSPQMFGHHSKWCLSQSKHVGVTL